MFFCPLENRNSRSKSLAILFQHFFSHDLYTVFPILSFCQLCHFTGSPINEFKKTLTILITNFYEIHDFTMSEFSIYFAESADRCSFSNIWVCSDVLTYREMSQDQRMAVLLWNLSSSTNIALELLNLWMSSYSQTDNWPLFNILWQSGMAIYV